MEKDLLQRAEQGEVAAMKELALLYEEKAKHFREPAVGESIEIEDFLEHIDDGEGDNEFNQKAYHWHLQAALKNDVESIIEVGRRLYDGIGVERDQPAAFEWYLKAAQMDNLRAIKIVAHSYNFGNGVESNEEKSFEWYLKAAQKFSDFDAIENVIKMYAKGNGVEKNSEKADEWFSKITDTEKAAEVAYSVWRECFDDKDLTWLKRAADLKYSMAFMELAEFEFANKNFPAATDYLKKVIENERNKGQAGSLLGEAHVQLGTMFYTGDGGEQSYEKAVQEYEKADKAGYKKGTLHLAKMYYYGLGVPLDFQMAIYWFHDVATSSEGSFFNRTSNSVAQEYMGRMFERGEYVPKDLNQAFLWYKKAAKDTRNYSALFKVAKMLYFGIGTKQNLEESFRYYEELTHFERYENYSDAVRKVIYMLENGVGTEKNLEKAEEFKRKLTEFEEFQKNI